MRRTFTVLALVAAMMMVTAQGAMAASPHFKKGGTPTCTIGGSGGTATVTCRGSITGLGNGDVVINTTLSGFAVYQCQNPGGNIAPGQNKVLVGPTTTPTTISGDEIKNGNLTFTALGSLTAPSTVSGAAAGCPNNSWTGVNPTLTVTEIRMTISQGGLLFTCTSASDPDGLSGTVALSC